MSPRTSLLAFAFLVTAFAGCVEPAPIDVPEEVTTLAWVAPELPTIDSVQMLADHKTFVKTFPLRANNGEGHKGARDALTEEFTAAGYEVWRHKFIRGIEQENICAVKIGVGAPTEWVVVGGHYDTTTTDGGDGEDGPTARVSEGAYDDGSGTRIVVDLAKTFATIDTYYSVLFCAFDGEERGLQGSSAAYGAMQDGSFPYEIDATRAMLDLDMFGICWPVRAPIYFDQNNPVLKAAVDEIRKGMEIPDDMWRFGGPSIYIAPLGISRQLGQSDYAPWYNSEDPYVPTAFFISDFSELGTPSPNGMAPTPGVPGAYPWWHFSDTVETMTQMAGGQGMLEAGFQTALDLTVATFSIMALHPEIDLGGPASA